MGVRLRVEVLGDVRQNGNRTGYEVALHLLILTLIVHIGLCLALVDLLELLESLRGA